MNFLTQSFKSLTSLISVNLNNHSNIIYHSVRFGNSLARMHKLYVLRATQDPPPKKKVLDGQPYAKGVVLKTLIKKPRKPNSANRKCVLVKLSNKKEMVAYVPGVGHTLQEHQTVLCRIKKLKDVPGVKLYCVRGKYDLPHVGKLS